MYQVLPQEKPTSVLAKTSLPVCIAVCCGATTLLLLASTIVLALIPIYTSTKSVTRVSTTSPKIYVNLGGEDNGSARRKRADSASDYIGDSFGPTASATLQKKLFSFVSENSEIDGISVPDVTIENGQSDAVPYTFLIIFQVYYKQRCDTACQNLNGKKLEALFKQKLSQNNFTLGEVEVYRSGSKVGTIEPRFIGFISISPIRSAITGSGPVTMLPTPSLGDQESNLVSLYLPMADSPSGRRRRRDSINDLNGGTVADRSLGTVQASLAVFVTKNNKAKGLRDLRCSIVILISGRRRRYTLAKRQSSRRPHLKCTFYVIFFPSCRTAFCKKKSGETVQNTLSNDSAITSISFPNIIIIFGSREVTISIVCTGSPTVSTIGAPDLGPSTNDNVVTEAPSSSVALSG